MLIRRSLLPLAEFARPVYITRPIFRNNPRPDVPMKRRMWPIAHPCNQTMFHRIDVTIFDVAGIIRFIPDEVFPKSPLPDTAFAFICAYMGQAFLLRQRLRKPRFDQTPAHGKIGISRRERPYRMDMIRQYDHGIDDERIVYARPRDGLAKSIDMVDQEGFSTIKKIDGEKPAASRYECATVVRHPRKLAILVTAQHTLRLCQRAQCV